MSDLDEPQVDEDSGRATAYYLFALACASGTRLTGDEIRYFRQWLDPDDFRSLPVTPLSRHVARTSQGQRMRDAIDPS